MKELCSVLWKIGSSVVITVPADIVKNLNIGVNKAMLNVSLGINGDPIKFLARPWKCGGSFVVTVPSAYVELYDLRNMVKNKTSVSAVLEMAKVGGNNRTKHGNTV